MSISLQPELYIGLQETFSKVITEGEAALFAGLVGDNRPRVSDFSRGANGVAQRMTIHDQFMVGVIGALLNTRIAGEGSKCVTMQYEFLAPIYCGDRIETVIELVEFDPAKHLATFKTDCYDQENNQVITGQVVLLVRA